MSAADRFREAAALLRGLVEAATPGPWIAEYSKKSGHCVIDAESQNALDSVVRATHFRDVGDAAYIATMHPGVGLALASWLDLAADDHDAGCTVDDRALWVADAILGGGDRG